MDRMIAIRIDGMVIGARACLDGIAHYMKENLSDEDYAQFVKFIGAAMMETIQISSNLYQRYPDITPKELDPAFKTGKPG